jgi:thymidine phosphorylase
VRALDDLELAPDRHVIAAEAAGFLATLDALAVGRATGLLGAGRARKGDDIDLGVGVELHAKPGDPVEIGQPLATLVHRGGRGLDEATALIAGAVGIAASAEPATLIHQVLPVD